MKNQLKYIWLTVSLTVIASGCMAQTIHSIVFCNTIDRSIGVSMERDLKNMLNEIDKIAVATDYDYDRIYFDGPNCTRNNLKKAIDEMYVEDDDIIITFYGGHGSHAKDNDEDPWPQYCMNSGFENQANWVPMQLLAKWIQAKGPRLAIILSNCCNVVQAQTTIKVTSMGYTAMSDVNVNNYRKLMSANGLVMATSSKLTEPSWCNETVGGLYTCDLMEALGKVGDGSIPPTWDDLLKHAYDLCSARDIMDREGIHYKQHPYYEVTPKGKTKINDRTPKAKDALGQALLDIVDKTKSKSSRLAMIPDIVEKYFSNYSLVLTVGTDMETIVDNEKPEDFLRRICLSPYIIRVNVISEDRGMLMVHEIRTQ